MVLSTEAIRSTWSLLISIDVRAISEIVPSIGSTTARGQLIIHNTSAKAVTQDMSQISETSSSIVDKGSPAHKGRPQVVNHAGLDVHPKHPQAFRTT